MIDPSARSRPRRPPRAIAVARARGAAPSLWWLALLVAASLLAGIASARAQDNPPAPPGTIAPPGSQAANPKMPGAATPSSPGTGVANLGNSNGVIRPPAGVDPGIAKPPPVSGANLPTPVIRPQQAPSGNAVVIPK